MREFSEVKDYIETSQSSQFPYLLSVRNAKIPINIVKAGCQSMKTKSHNPSNLDCETGSYNAPSREKIAREGTFYQEARGHCYYCHHLKML